MTYQSLFIQPTDVWFFRTAKPFTAGQDQWAETYFPPTPRTMQGVIRSHTLMVQGGLDKLTELEPLMGNSHSYGRLHLRGPFLGKFHTDGTVKRYFPIPTDLVLPKEEQPVKQLQRLKLTSHESHLNNHPNGLQWLMTDDEQTRVEAAFGWLDESQMSDYLTGTIPTGYTPSDAFYAKEYRLGIEMLLEQRVTKEQQLYQADFIRLHEQVGLVLDVALANLDKDKKPLEELWQSEKAAKSGYLAIGGEARAGSYQQVPLNQALFATEITSKRFVLYFATPTYFERGWQPKNWGDFFEGQVKLLTAATGRPMLISGWDLKARQPKRLRRYVSAGSVYYFEAESERVRLKKGNVCDDVHDAQIGFGQVLVGQLP